MRPQSAGLVCSGLALVLLAAGAARPQEPPPSTDTGADVDLISRVPFHYEKRGRDIFTFREAPSKDERLIDLKIDILTPDDLGDGTGEETGGTGDDGGGREADDGDKGAERARVREVMRRQAAAKYGRAEKLFVEQRFEEAARRCDSGIKDLESAGVEAPDLDERLSRLRKASEAMRDRAKAEKEFEEVNISIQSVVYRERSPVAVINGRVVKENQFVAGTNAQVFKIERGFIVFLFRGLKIRKQMQGM